MKKTINYNGRSLEIVATKFVHPFCYYDYKIYELCEDMLTKDEWGNDLLKLLPIKDYPMFLIFGDCEL